MRETLVKTEEYKDSPVGRIPKDWEVYTLGECVRPDAPITYGIVQAGSHVEGGVPYIRTGDMAGDRLSLEGLLRTSPQIAASYRRSEVRTGEIVCAIRATVGKVLEVPPELDGANLTQGTARIASRENINNHFLLWALRSNYAQRQFDLAVKGTTFSEITLENLRKIYVALPSSRDEEDRIAEILDMIDSAIAHTSSLIAKLKQMKAGLLHDLLTRGLDENGELRDAIGHPEQFKDSPLGQIPKDWEVKSLAEISRQITDGVHATPNYTTAGIPFISVNNLVGNSISFDSCQFISEADHEILIRRCHPEQGDILLGKVATLGIVDVVVTDKKFSIFVQVALIKLKAGLIPKFIKYSILHKYLQDQIHQKASGTTIRYIGIEMIGKLLIKVPSKKEQELIAAILDTYDTRIRAEESYRDKLKLQKQGLMHDLLTGKVRVKDADKFTSASDTVQLVVGFSPIK